MTDSYYPGHLVITDNSAKPVFIKTLFKNITPISLKIQANGKLTFFGGNKFYMVDDSFDIIDSFSCSQGRETDFHDFTIEPDGHCLIIGVEYDTVDMSAIVPGGQKDAVILSNFIEELDENKNPVFEWRAIDHYLITDATDGIDLTQKKISFVHINSVCSDNDGNLIVSSRNLDEITKINRQTGAIMWRLGGQECRNNQFHFLNDTLNGFRGFSHQHSVTLLPNGNLLMFDNGNLRPEHFSRAVEYQIDQVNKTIKKVWEYRPFPDLFSMSMGSVQRLPNGNTMICWGTNNQYKSLTEVRSDGSRAIDIVNFQPYSAFRYVFKMSSAAFDISNSGNYNFNPDTVKTGISLNLTGFQGSGYTSVERHYYLPHNSSFEGSPPTWTYSNRWVVNNKGISDINGKIIFDLTKINDVQSPAHVQIYQRTNEGSGTFTSLNTQYDSTSNTLQADIHSFGEFILCLPQTYPTPILLSPRNDEYKQTENPLLKWNTAKGAISYILRVSASPDFESVIVDSSGLADTTFNLNNLKFSKRYWWKIKADYGSTQSDWSPVWRFTTKLEIPKLIFPNDAQANVNLSDFIKWDTVHWANYYNISVSKDKNFDSINIEQSGIRDTVFQLYNLDDTTTYYWRVMAANQNNLSDWSESRSFRTGISYKPSPPILLYPSTDTTDVPLSGELVWDTVPLAKYYKLELSLYFDFIEIELTRDSLFSSFFNYSNLKPNTTYYWHVASVYSDGETKWSNISNFTTLNPNNVANSINTNSSPNLYYDNLINGFLIINVTHATESEFILCNVTGCELLNFKNLSLFPGNNIINCKKKFSDGVYFYKLKINTHIYCGIIIITD